MNPADIIGIIIVLAFIVWGAHKGFMKSVFSLVSFIIALILAFVLSPYVSGFLESSVVGSYVYKSTAEMLPLKTEAESAISSLPLPKVMTKNLAGKAEHATQSVHEQVVVNIADTALSILSLIIVFILVKFLLFLLSHFLDLIARLPVIRSANKLFGGIFGAINGILIVYIILTVLTFGATVKTFQKPLETVIESRIVSVMYHQNILLNFLQ